MFGVDDGQGAIRQIAWYIWQYLRRYGQERSALDNWLMAEQMLFPGRANNADGQTLAWMYSRGDFMPFD